jgi:hypothetical protein
MTFEAENTRAYRGAVAARVEADKAVQAANVRYAAAVNALSERRDAEIRAALLAADSVAFEGYLGFVVSRGKAAADRVREKTRQP